MKYKISLNDEDYLRFNIFYINHSKAGKHSICLARIVFPFLAAVFLMAFCISGAKSGLIVIEAVFLGAACIVWSIYVPKIMEKSIRKNIGRMKADGKLPYHADSEIEFQDAMIVESNSQGEVHVKYKDVQNIYSEKDYLYIFYGAAEAFIVPDHCLGGDKERVAAYIMEKSS